MAKSASALKLVTVIALILVGAFVFLQPLINQISLGLDLQGGVHVVLQARAEEGQTVSGDEMRQLQSVMRQRVDEFGVSEPIIQISGNDRLLVELAGVANPQQAVDMIGRTAKLEFLNADGDVVVTGAMLSNARANLSDRNEPEVILEFNSEGARLFEAETRRVVTTYPERHERRVIAITLDEEVLTVPYVQTTITNGVATISGGFATFDDAANLASLLRGGALPLSTDIIELRTVGPTLGSDSLDRSLTAIMVGLALLALFMILLYRLPGLLANLTLIVFGILVLLGLRTFNAVLTLPGMAGILLTVAMAADANIIIFERIKDEIRNGKTLRASVESGFKRAFRTILDSNLTTIIGAAVLFQLGTGAIRGFALTLMIGIAANMITALLLTKLLLRLAVGIPVLSKKHLFGIHGKELS